MSVDKFGRYQSGVKARKAAKRVLREDVAFKITADGHVDMENKNIRNLGEPTALGDAVPLNYIQDKCLFVSSDSVDVRGKKLMNVSNPVAFTDAANKYYVDFKFLKYMTTGNNNNEAVIDARDHRIMKVKDPQWAQDAANKQYVDSKTLSTDQQGNLSVSNRRLTELAAPHYDNDAVTLQFLLQNTVFKINDIFNASGRKIVNVADGTSATEAVNLRQLNSVKRYIQKELYNIVTILNIRIEEIVTALYILHGDAARESVKSDIKSTVSAFIRKLYNTHSSEEKEEEYDWRSYYQSP